MCEYSREHKSCVRTAGDMVSTAGDMVSTAAVGIIQYWEGTPHLVLISVKLYSDPKISSCLAKFLSQKFPRVGVFELFFPEQIFGEQIFRKHFFVKNRFFFTKNFFTPPTQIIVEKKSSVVV